MNGTTALKMLLERPPGCRFGSIRKAYQRDKKKLLLAKQFLEGDRWGSNPRQPEPQTGTLPAELRPPRFPNFHLGVQINAHYLSFAIEFFPSSKNIEFIVNLQAIFGLDGGYARASSGG